MQLPNSRQVITRSGATDMESPSVPSFELCLVLSSQVQEELHYGITCERGNHLQGQMSDLQLNQSMQPMEASHSVHCQFARLRRLAPTADARRSPT